MCISMNIVWLQLKKLKYSIVIVTKLYIAESLVPDQDDSYVKDAEDVL